MISSLPNPLGSGIAASPIADPSTEATSTGHDVADGATSKDRQRYTYIFMRICIL